MQRMCHEFDMNFGGSWGSNSIIPAENKAPVKVYFYPETGAIKQIIQ